MHLSRVGMKLSYDNAGTSSRMAPSKPKTHNDTVGLKMNENVLGEVDWPGITTLVPFGARKIPSLLDSDVCWSWPLIHRVLLQPVWKQHILFRLLRRREERHCISLATAYRGHTLTGSIILVYDFSCFVCLLHNVTSFCISGAAAQLVRDGGDWTQRRKERADKHRAKLLAATQQLFEKLEELSSCPARGATGDDANVEQDSQGCQIAQDTPVSPAFHDACGHCSRSVGSSRSKSTRGNSCCRSSLTARARRSCILSKTIGISGGCGS
jgi:hypothetical protein